MAPNAKENRMIFKPFPGGIRGKAFYFSKDIGWLKKKWLTHLYVQDKMKA